MKFIHEWLLWVAALVSVAVTALFGVGIATSDAELVEWAVGIGVAALTVATGGLLMAKVLGRLEFHS